MQEILPGLLLVLQLVTIGAFVWLARRTGTFELTSLQARLDSIERAQEKLERSIREDFAANRQEAGRQARELREEVQNSIKNLTESMSVSVGQISRAQSTQLEEFRNNLNEMSQGNQKTGKELREEISGGLKGFGDSMVKNLGEMAGLQKAQLEEFSNRLRALTESNEKKLETLRTTVEGKLTEIRTDNEKKLEEMRRTVDEKLEGTLEKRLGESFKLVSERLEQVHKGLGEMQSLASGVGDLKKVLTNVKTRGTWGEFAVGNLLEQVLSPDQYAANVTTKEGSAERVEFAIKLPGKSDREGEIVWLPIDAKFPKEDYERLVDATDRADPAGIEDAARQLDLRVRNSARDISEKYLNPPATTDFALMYLPTEGLYAEVLRRPGLVEGIQRQYRVSVAGPATLAAFLNSLQMGFRTLAIEKRSSEVWKVLGAVKTEFGKFGDVLGSVKKKLHQATDTIDRAEVRTRAITRKLRSVEELPVAEARSMLTSSETTTEEPEVAET